MTTFSYNTGVPTTNNNPSVDQPDMLLNTQATNGILDVDHIGFNAANGGMHKQSTYPAVTAQGAQSGLASVAYTKVGVANTGAANLSFKNSSAEFSLNGLRAFGVFQVNTAANTVILLNGTNMTGGTSATGSFTVALAAGSYFGNNVAFSINLSNGGAVAYSFVGGTLTLTNAQLIGTFLASITAYQI